MRSLHGGDGKKCSETGQQPAVAPRRAEILAALAGMAAPPEPHGDGNPMPEGWRWFPVCSPRLRRAEPAVPPRTASPFGREVAAVGHRQPRPAPPAPPGSAAPDPRDEPARPPGPGQGRQEVLPRASIPPPGMRRLPSRPLAPSPRPIPHAPHPGSALPQVELF